MRKAVIDNTNNLVVSVVEWPGCDDFAEPQGFTCVPCSTVRIYDRYDPENRQFLTPDGEIREKEEHGET